MSAELLLEEADKLEHANKVLIRDLTAGEKAVAGANDVMLVCIVRPQYPQWARAEVFVDLDRVADPTYRAEVLSVARKILSDQFPSLLPATQQRAKNGEFKEPKNINNICAKARSHVPKAPEPPSRPMPPAPAPVPIPEPPVPPPVPMPEPEPVAVAGQHSDLAGKIIKRK